jgi:hypothetical protein
MLMLKTQTLYQNAVADYNRFENAFKTGVTKQQLTKPNCKW